jgi:hypothetical protein
MLPDTLALVWQNGHWEGLAFDVPFNYNGTDNLIIEYRWQGDDNLSVYDLGFYTSGNRAMNASSSTAPTGTPRNYMPRVRIFYETVGLSEYPSTPPARPALSGPSIVSARSSLPCFDALGRRSDARSTGVFFVPDASGVKRRASILRRLVCIR